MTDRPSRPRRQAFRQFQYPTVPLGVSSDYKNVVLRRALDDRFHLGGNR